MNEIDKPLTPEEFASEMTDLATKYKGDQEVMHMEMDALMGRQLESLGFSEGVSVFDSAPKWYA